MKFQLSSFGGLRLGVALLAVAIFSGCSEIPGTRVYFPHLTVNGQPAPMNLDTGAFSTLITNENMNALDVKYGKLPPGNAAERYLYSQPVNLSVGPENYTVRLPIYALPWVAHWPLAENMVGVIGWPEVRDNILRFDGAMHTISAVPAVPADTASWVKLKIYKNNLLLLEIPLPENKIGLVLVDTGSPEGIHLAELQFNTWKKAHPNSEQLIFDPYSPAANNFGDDLHDIIHDENYWADEVQLGGLTFSHMPLRKAWRMETQLVDYYMGTLGMYALGQMEMVVDYKSGWAYARTLKTPFKKGDWTVDESVHLNIEKLLMDAAEYNGRVGDYDSAIADYTQELQRDPQNGQAYASRGLAQELRGNYEAALADFHQAIGLNSGDPNFLNIFCYLMEQRLSPSAKEADETTQTFTQMVSTWPGGWSRRLGRFVAGDVNMDEAAILADAVTDHGSGVLGQRCEVYYFAGMLRLIKGDQAGARERFQKSLATGEQQFREYMLAGAELARLDAAAKK